MPLRETVSLMMACSAILLALMLAGCQRNAVRSAVTSPVKTAVPSVSSGQGKSFQEPRAAMKEASRLELCRKELEALQSLNGASPRKDYQSRFDTLMQEISRYSGLRDGAGSDTRETVDALYRYRVNRLCAEVHLALLNGLSDRGEQAK